MIVWLKYFSKLLKCSQQKSVFNFVFAAYHNRFSIVNSPRRNKKVFSSKKKKKRKAELFRWTLSFCPWTLSPGQKKNDAAYAAYAYVSSPHYVYARGAPFPTEGRQRSTERRTGGQTHLYGKLFLMLLMRQSVVSFSLFAQAAPHLNASPPLWLLVFVCVCVCAAVEL